MSSQLCPSDLTDREWEYIKRLIPAPKPGGRKRKTEMRLTLNAIFYVLRTGCQWRYLPREYPPWETVYGYFRTWCLTGVWERIHDRLRDLVREQEGRERQPTAAILDSQSVKTTIGAGLSAASTRASKSLGGNDISWLTRWACCCWSWCTRLAHKTVMGRARSWCP